MNNITTSELLSKIYVVNNNKRIYKNNKILVIDFYADWCQPCKAQETVLKELKKEYSMIEFYKVNIEEEYQLAEIFSIKSLPTVIVFGKDIKTLSGFTQKQKIEEIIKKQIEIFV